ncbi:MAG TPA: hypothetical protein VK675_00840 [Candidatus Paceibacterota bacterium]|nr:hypothetical protein [Candidatus Paceibacterota bacterium]
MISVSLFIIIVMAGMGALLNANLLHQKSQDMHSILDNLSFIMDDMSRNLREGYGYHCINDGVTSGGTLKDTRSCLNGTGVSFNSLLDNSQWVYYMGIKPDGKYGIFKSVGGVPPYQLTPDEIDINSAPGFSVLGAEAFSQGNLQQPFVTIRLEGKITYKGVDTPFSLQTSVSQRAIDNL